MTSEGALQAKNGLLWGPRTKEVGRQCWGAHLSNGFLATAYAEPQVSSLTTDALGRSAVCFCLWSLGQAVNSWICEYTVLCFYPVCPNQQVTVIFGFVPILPPNVISHILLPLSALNRQSLWWSQTCFGIPWEPQCQAVTAPELPMEKAVIWGGLALSLWVIMETLSPDAAVRDRAAGESICQMRSWPPDISKCSTPCGMSDLPSGILVTLKLGLFYSIFSSLTVSNVLEKTQNTFFFRLQK